MIFRLQMREYSQGKITCVLPSYQGIALTHVLQILHEFPHTWIVDFYFIDVNGEHREASASEKI
jgi:hypothetical protein